MISEQEAAMKLARIFTFGPKVQRQLSGDRYKLLLPTAYNKPQAPTLICMRDAFGDDFLHGWMESNLIAVSSIVGGKGKVNAMQIATCANTLISKFTGEGDPKNRLTAAEVQLFFSKMLSGDFGKFYGSMDILTIGEWAGKFLEWRYDERNRIEQEQEEQNRIAEARKLEEVTYRPTKEEIDALMNAAKVTKRVPEETDNTEKTKEYDETVRREHEEILLSKLTPEQRAEIISLKCKIRKL